MRVCIVYSSVNNKKIEEFASALKIGIEQQPKTVVDIINIDKESEKKLTGYKYLLFGCSKSSLFGSKLSDSFKNYIKNCGSITGKHTFAFTTKGLRSQKFLVNLMAGLESQGVLLKTSAIINSTEEAKVIGSKLHIK